MREAQVSVFWFPNDAEYKTTDIEAAFAQSFVVTKTPKCNTLMLFSGLSNWNPESTLISVRIGKGVKAMFLSLSLIKNLDSLSFERGANIGTIFQVDSGNKFTELD